MELYRGIPLLLFVLASTAVAEARTSMRRSPPKEVEALQVKQASAEKAHVSPEVTTDHKKFFDKDYPFDKRPDAKHLAFKHPYPVVQDSGDFDKDYVKDENSDNGSWKAQESYDRLRVKLAKEKKDLAKALGKKLEEEKEMQNAMSEHDKEERARAEAAAKAAAARKAAEEEDNIPPPIKKAKVQIKKAAKDINKVFDPIKEVLDIKDVSTADTEKAMANLEDCKKELAAARQALKDLMKELEDAKKKQTDKNGALDEAMKKEIWAKEHHSSLKKQVKSEYEEYQAARKAYLTQKDLVAKLEADIKVAAAKVKVIRDSEDSNGGVYQTRPHKSGVFAAQWMSALVLALVAVCSA